MTGIGKIDGTVLVMQRLIFVLICTLLILKPTANAIFLSNLGVENLPVAYLSLAILALIITIVYTRYVSTVSTKRLFINSTMINIILLVLIGVMLLNSWSKMATAFIFYLFISIFGILSASQFWIIANQVFNAREARKYFGFIGSGAIAGGIVGGYLASIISTVTQSEFIPFAAAGLLIYAIFLVKKVQKEHEKPPEREELVSYVTQLYKPFKLVKEITHLKYLAILLALSVFVAKMIDYQFGYFATRIFTEEETLTQFYGFWFSTFNIISLLVQIFLTGRIVGRLGVGYSILILPVLIIINVSLLLLVPVILLVISMKLVDASMKQSINKASMELMMLPVPEDIKLKTKTFLDVFIDSLATGASGLILLFVVKGLDLPNQVISLVILIGALLWFYIGNKMRVEYKNIFRQSLKIQSEKVATVHSTIIEDYKQLLDSGNEFQVLKALSFLKKNTLTGIEDNIIKLLHHENSKIVDATLEMIMYKEEDFHDAVIPLLSHHHQNVKINAFEYLINHQQQLEPNFLIKLLNESDEEIKIAAIAAYAKEFQNNRSVLNVLRIGDRIKMMLQEHDVKDDKKIYKTIGLLKSISLGKFSEYYSFILTCLEYGSDKVQSHALLAAGETNTTQYLKILLEKLNQKDITPTIYSALAKYGSNRIGRIFQNLLKKNDLNRARKIPSVLELIPDQRSIDLLQQMAEHQDYTLRNNAIASLYALLEKYPLLRIDEQVINKILLDEAKYNNKLLNVLLLEQKVENPHYQVLVTLLKKRIDNNLSTIFKLLHIKYPPDNFIEIYDYVKGPDQALRDNSIEYLENSLGPQLKSSIISLIEYNVLHIETNILKRNHKDTELNIKDFLCNNRDPEIKSAALQYYDA